MRAGLIVALCLCVGALTVAQSAVPALAGEYVISGETARGPYHGTATVLQKGRAVFVRWQSPSGDLLQGFGVIQGDRVAVGYAAEDVGVAVLYRIEQDRLVGEWPSADAQIWPETLTKGAPRMQAQR